LIIEGGSLSIKHEDYKLLLMSDRIAGQ